MIQQDYLIAGHRVRIEGEALVRAVGAIKGFEVFKAEAGAEPLCRFVEAPFTADAAVLSGDANRLPGIAKVLYAIEIDGVRSCFGTRTGGGYVFGTVAANGSILLLDMEEDGSVTRFSGDFNPRQLRFACWIAYGVAAAPHKTVAIHTSTIRYRDRAVLFLGESGTGKSTHTRLWREHIAGAELLNDDSPIVRIVDGRAFVYGSPWSGKTDCYKNEYWPLAACVRLSQAPYNKIDRLGVVAGYAALHPSCPPAFAYDERLYDHISAFLSDILSTVPVYHLDCLPDADAARLSCQTVFGTCGK